MNKSNIAISCFGTVLLCAISAVGYSTWIVPSSTNYGGTAIANKDTKPVVAYIKNGEKKTYYTSVETAVIQANLKDSENNKIDVWVIPNTQYTITSSFNIDQYVTLNLPFQDEIVFDVWKTKDGKYAQDGTEGVSAVKALDNENTYRKTQLSIKSGASITNNGTINIGGVIGGQGGSSGPCGQTCYYYSEIKCLATNNTSAQIINKGTIKNQGCISGLNETTYAVENLSGSTLKTVLTLGENRGGTALCNLGGGYAAAVANKLSFTASPFNTVYMSNVRAKSKSDANSFVIGLGAMYGNDAHNQVEISLYGNSSSYLFQSDGGYVFYSVNKDDKKNDVLNLDFYGSHKINYMQMSITVPIFGSRDVKTNTVLFPLSYCNNVSFNSDGSNKAIVISGQDIKIMPGGKLTIGKNVDFSIGKMAVYDSSFVDPSKDNKYPTGYSDGLLNVGGNLVVNSFGGFVSAEDAGASLSIKTSNSVESPQIKNSPYNKAEYDPFVFNAQGFVSTDKGTSSSKQNLTTDNWYLSGKNDLNTYWVERVKHQINITAVSYTTGFPTWWRYYPVFNVYVADDSVGTNKQLVSDLSQTKSDTTSVGTDSSKSLSNKIEEGKFIYIDGLKECDDISGASLKKWIEVTGDMNITITAKK